MKKSALSLLISGLLIPPSLYAIDSQLVYNGNNTPVFLIRFFDVEDGNFTPGDEDGSGRSVWNLNQSQKDKILYAMRYWAEVIKPASGTPPAIINVGTVNDENAFGSSPHISAKDISMTSLQGALYGIDLPEEDLTFGSHAQFSMGKMDWDTVPYLPSQLPRTGKADLSAVALHELAHGLGIAASARDLDGRGKTPLFDPDQPLSTYDALLRDDNGNPARPGQTILCTGCNNAWDPEGFDVRHEGAHLTGQNINEVLAGAMPGVPVGITGPTGYVDDNYMSHLELTHSLMSHQDYRNYTSFMEAELAVLQDMGYDIDRRNFFGYSVYGDGKTLINKHGYFLRNDEGDGYIAGKYNTAPLGVGLHVYGSNNQITQQADLLTQGDGGAGIRVDGENNLIEVDKNTRIYADGVNGRGIMFTYGKEHNLIQRGDVQALGMNGVALSFDFGNNLLGNESGYRGSWIYYDPSDFETVLLPELEGALADKVDISGRVAGNGAAIYLSQTALVNEINILKGATLSGDIFSDYHQRDEYGELRLTELSFGQLADAQGRATEQADANFNLAYNGNIKGINNLAVSAIGGGTALNGEHEIYSMLIAPGAKLSGNSDYLLNTGGTFINNGLLSPGNSLGKITIKGDYQQGNSGQLLLEFDGKGQHDTFVVDGQASYDGKLTFAPVKDWYANNWRLDSQAMLKASQSSGSFSEVTSLFNSPTLSLQITSQQNAGWQLSMARAADAYSQYAQDDNARQAGQALDRIVANARADIQPLYRNLDFSSADGSGIRAALPQLTPAAYSAIISSSLNRERQIIDILNAPLSSAAADALAQGDWQSFAIPFGGGYWQQRQGNHIGYKGSSYGVVFGVQKQNLADGNLELGLHGAASRQSTSVKAPENGKGKTTAFEAGIQAHYAADLQQGSYFFGHGRLGIEDGNLTRNVYVGDYRAKHDADWTGWSGALTGGAGYQYALSENLSVGPVASLNYTLLHRPEITEKGGKASRLNLKAERFDSLRASIGVTTDWHKPLTSDTALSAQMQLSWDRELLDTEFKQNASFANYRNAGFNSKNKVTGRDALGVKAGVRYHFTDNIEMGANVSSDLFRSGYSAVAGNVSATWHF